jgi:hypothetical protein
MLAEALGCSFIEADDYHSQANKGTPPRNSHHIITFLKPLAFCHFCHL